MHHAVVRVEQRKQLEIDALAAKLEHLIQHERFRQTREPFQEDRHASVGLTGVHDHLELTGRWRCPPLATVFLLASRAAARSAPSTLMPAASRTPTGNTRHPRNTAHTRPTPSVRTM